VLSFLPALFLLKLPHKGKVPIAVATIAHETIFPTAAVMVIGKNNLMPDNQVGFIDKTVYERRQDGGKKTRGLPPH
jgi:hypothetical protein